MDAKLLLATCCALPLLLNADEKRATVPFDELSEKDAERVEAVVKHRSFKRDLDQVEFTGTEAIYAFLLDRMPFAADAVRALDIERYRVKDNEDGTYTADDGAGATGTFELVHSEKGKKVFYALGNYDGKLLKIRGRCVAVVEFEEKSGNKILNWVSIYFKFDSLVISTFVKVISPFLGPMIDKKIQYFLNATRTLCRVMVEDPGKVYTRLDKAKEMDRKSLKEFHEQFVEREAAKPLPDKPAKS